MLEMGGVCVWCVCVGGGILSAFIERMKTVSFFQSIGYILTIMEEVFRSFK